MSATTCSTFLLDFPPPNLAQQSMIFIDEIGPILEISGVANNVLKFLGEDHRHQHPVDPGGDHLR